MDVELKQELFSKFVDLGETALTANHYELANISDIANAQVWKQFLMEPDVEQYIKKEMEVIRASEINKMIYKSASSRSVGQSQLLSALQKFGVDEEEDKGPTFIYCYVPLNEEQRKAPNVRICNGAGVTQTESGVYEINDTEA